MTVVELVERERRHLRRLHLTAGAAAGAAAALALVAVGALVLGGSRWLALPRGVPLLVWLLVIAALAAAAWATRRRVRREASASGVAAEIEREQGLRQGAVRTALEVEHTGPLGRYAADAVAARLTPVRSLAPAARRSAGRRWQWAAGAAAVAAALVLAEGAVVGDGLAAIARPVDAWRGTLLGPIEFVSPPASVLRGQPVELRVRAPGRHELRLSRRAVGGDWTHLRVPVDARTGVARASLGRAEASLTLLATDGRAVSDTLALAVTDRPFVGDLTLRADYPAYLGRPAETLPAGDRLRLPRGTRLSVSGRSSVPLAALSLVRDTAAHRLTTTEYRFDGTLAVQASGTWRFRAEPRGGVPPDVPAPLEIEMLPDSAPRVDIRSPAADTTLVPGTEVRLAIEAGDDHGLAAIGVRSWRERADGEREAPRTQGVAAPNEVLWSGETALASTGGLAPGDRLHLVVTAADNSPWRQTAESRELVLRVPSLGEQRASARKLADSAAAGAAAVAAAQRQLAQRSGELSRMRGDRGTNGSAAGTGSSRGSSMPMGYEQAERARQLAQEQRELASRVEQVRRQARQVEQQLRQAGAMDSALSARMQEAQRLLREALTPELAAKLQELENAAQRGSADEARSAMQDLARQQQQAREALDQGVEMLKRAALEGAMQTLRDDAREVAKQERDAGRAMAEGRQAPQSAQELSARSREVASDVRNVQERLRREGAKAAPDKMESAADHANKSAGEIARAGANQPDAARQTASARGGRDSAGARAGGDSAGRPGAQQGAQQGPQQGGTPQAGQRGDQPARAEQGAQQGANPAERAASEMEQAAQDLADARDAQVGQWKDELTRDLDRSIQETLQLAREESTLAEAARQQQAGEANGQGGRDSSGSQQPGDQQQGQRPPGEQNRAGEQGGARQPSGQQGAAGEQGQPGEKGEKGGRSPGQSGSAGERGTERSPGGQQRGESPGQGNAPGERGGRPGGQQPGQQNGQQNGQQGAQPGGQPAGSESGANGAQPAGGEQSGDLRSRQSTLQQGTNRASERLEQAARKSALVSPRSQRAMADARQKVESATRETSSGSQSASGSMQEAAAALNQAAAAMVRDRERANSASSASGLPELLQRLQEAAKQQGNINSQSGQGMPAGQQGGPGQQGAGLRGLARQQRRVAESLEEVGDADATGRTDALAKEARELAQAMERGAADEQTVARQQRLHRRLLDAGRSMEQEEREDNGRREAQSATGNALFTPGTTSANGRAGAKFREPDWNDLRGLSAEERRLVLEYFKRLNATP